MLRCLALTGILVSIPTAATAQGAPGTTSTTSPGEAAAANQSSQQPEPEPDPVDSQEIGVLLGAAIGGDVSPGGIAVDGRYLYRMSDLDWFEVGASFALGSGAAECFRDRESELQCEHGLVDGFAAEASAGLRRYFTGQQQFRPYARAGVGLRLISFADDELRGLAVPVYAGGGIRVDVANRVLVVAEANVRGGPALMGRGLGLEPNFGLSIGAGVEFTLD